MAVGAAPDHRARPQIRQVEAVAVADQQLDVGRLRRRDHLAAILDRQRHRLFDQHVLAVFRGEFHMRHMKLMRRGDVDGSHIGVSAERLDILIDLRVELSRKALACLRAGIAGGNEHDPRIGRKRRQHQGEGAAEADDAEFEGLGSWVFPKSSSMAERRPGHPTSFFPKADRRRGLHSVQRPHPTVASLRHPPDAFREDG